MSIPSRQQIRQTVSKKRRHLTLSQQKLAARLITQRVLRTPQFKFRKHIAFYLPVKGEVNTVSLLQQALRMNKHCYLPVLHPLKHNRLYFVAYKANDPLVKNCYGILEPKFKTARIMPTRNLNLALTPLV